MISRTILHMRQGFEMNEAVTEQLRVIFTNMECKAWSTDPLAAVELRDLIGGFGYNVNQLHRGRPDFYEIQNVCTIQDADNVELRTEYGARSWIESLCKCFLLFRHGHHGTYLNVELDAVIKTSKPSTTAQIYRFPDRGKEED